MDPQCKLLPAIVTSPCTQLQKPPPGSRLYRGLPTSVATRQKNERTIKMGTTIGSRITRCLKITSQNINGHLTNSLTYTFHIAESWTGLQTCQTLKSITFWDVTPCSLLSCNRRFGATYRLHLQGRRNNFLLLLSFLRPWRFWQYVPPKRRLQLNRLHGVIS
jgi:hypothetical protein